MLLARVSIEKVAAADVAQDGQLWSAALRASRAGVTVSSCRQHTCTESKHLQVLTIRSVKPTGVQCTVVSTERLNHARQVLQSLPAEELARFDGVVAVGGDGLFQEALNGLLTLRRELSAAQQRCGHTELFTPPCWTACPDPARKSSIVGVLLCLPCWSPVKQPRGARQSLAAAVQVARTQSRPYLSKRFLVACCACDP